MPTSVVEENENLIMVTGCPETGKTALMQNLVSRIHAAFQDVRTSGFLTESVKVRGTRQGYDVVSIDGTRTAFARPYPLGSQSPKVSNYHLNLPDFEAVVLPAVRIQPDDTLRGLYVVDGIGKLELTSKRFAAAFRKLWRSGHVVVATVSTTANKAMLDDLSDLHPVVLKLTSTNWRATSDELFERVSAALERDADVGSDDGSSEPTPREELPPKRRIRNFPEEPELEPEEQLPIVSLHLDGEAYEGRSLFARLTVDGRQCGNVPPPNVLVEWSRDDITVASGTLELPLRAVDAGRTIAVTCTPCRRDGTPAVAQSVIASLVVEKRRRSRPVKLRLVGLPVEDNVLQAVATVEGEHPDDDEEASRRPPVACKLQWRRDDQLILSDSWTYPLTASDVGHRVQLTLTPLQPNGVPVREDKQTVQTDPIRKASVRRLELLGSPVERQELSIQYDYDGNAEVRWYRVHSDGSEELVSRGSDHYVPDDDDVGVHIKVEVQPTNTAHSPAEAYTRCPIQGLSSPGLELHALSSLRVAAVEGKDFPAMDRYSRNDCFAVLTLGAHRHQTAVCPNSDRPTWRGRGGGDDDEQLVAYLDTPGPMPTHLFVEVYEEDADHSDLVGSARIALAGLPVRGGGGGGSGTGWFDLVTPQGAHGGSVRLEFDAECRTRSLPGSPLSSWSSAASVANKKRREAMRLVGLQVTAVRGQNLPESRANEPKYVVLMLDQDSHPTPSSATAEWNHSHVFPTSSTTAPPKLHVEVRSDLDRALLCSATVPMSSLPLTSQNTVYENNFALAPTGKILLRFEAVFQRVAQGGSATRSQPAPVVGPGTGPVVAAPSLIPPPAPTVLAAPLQLPTTLMVHVVRAEGLRKMDRIGESDPYVVLRLGRIEHRSSVKDNNANPTWNESYGFSLNAMVPTEIPPLEIQVFDEDDVGEDDLIGYASFRIQDIEFRPPSVVRVEKWFTLKADDTPGPTGKLLLAFEGYFRGMKAG